MCQVRVHIVTLASPAEYDESICAAAAMRSVATITAVTCWCLRLCVSALRRKIAKLQTISR